MVYSRMGKNARLGDGSLVKQKSSINVYLFFCSTDKKLLDLKLSLCKTEGLKVTREGKQKSGYSGKKIIYNFGSRVSKSLTEVFQADTEDIIRDLDKEDLYLWYLDDGSWHKNKHIMNLYSNSLSKEESNALITRIEYLYGIKPRLRVDRKRDGREFYYLYFPRELLKKFRPEVEAFIERNQLDSMYYKVGGKNFTEKIAN